MNKDFEMGMRYLSITSPDINNGLGCRVTLWVAGCTRGCPHCQNCETWIYNQGKKLSEAYSELSDILSKEYIQGITISGGDPLDQCDTALHDLKHLLEWVKKNFNKDIWIYTGGVFEDMVNNELYYEIFSLCDVLVDGPYIHEIRDITLPFRGSKNQRIIDLKETLKNGSEVVIKEIQ